MSEAEAPAIPARRRPPSGLTVLPDAQAQALREENERLRARLAELEAKAAEPQPIQASVPAGLPGRYRVTLPGCKVRAVDAQGRIHYQDYLDVDAPSEPHAFEAFRKFNGIISTSQVPTIERLGD